MKYRNRILSLLLALVLFVSAMPLTAMAKGDIVTGVAWILGQNLRLRTGASTSAKTFDYGDKGDVAVVLGKQGNWYKVNYNNQIGYMSADYLDVVKKENVELGYGRVNANKVNTRKGAGTSYARVGQTNTGDMVYIIGVNNGWYKVINGTAICYIRSDYVDLTQIPYENVDSTVEPVFFRGGKSNGTKVSAANLKKAQEAAAKAETTQNQETTDTSSGLTGKKIVAKAKTYLGVPYVWNSVDPEVGFDCSGFVYFVYNSMGYEMPRTQDEMYKKGKKIARESLKVGDVVFFQNTYKAGLSHCGIYIGDGEFIHASSGGDRVKIDSLDSKYYAARYYGACRYI